MGIPCIKKARYDAQNDVLYIRFDVPSDFSYGDEEEDGIIIMKNYHTQEVTGITVFYPKRDMRERETQLRKFGYPIILSQYIH